MGKSTVIADGDKIKEIRKKYNLKQDEISGRDITRNLISEIETGVANITKKTAEIIIKNLKEMGSKRGFKVTETVEYLMENQIVQATKILDSYIEELKRLLIAKDDSFIETLKTTKSFLADWNINEKATIIYELAGDYFYIQNEMYESIMYYEKALTAIGKLLPSQELLEVFFKITKAYIHIENYYKAIENSNFVIEHFDNLPLEYIRKFTYNRAWAYYLTHKYELALNDIEKVENIINKDDKKNYFIALKTKAACFYLLQRYDESLEIYNKLLNLLDNRDLGEKIVIFINIAETYLAQSEKEKAIGAFNIARNDLPLITNNKYEATIYFEIGNIYKELSNVDEAYKYYSRALDTAKLKKEYALLADILYVMLENTSSVQIINKIKNEVFALITKQDKLSDKLVHKLLDFYADNGDIINIREINHFALQFIA